MVLPPNVYEPPIEEVDKYVCLDKTVMRDGDLMPEIKRRTALA